jgi:hypothetical protein
MKDIQAFAKQYQKELGWDISTDSYQESRESLLHNYLLFSTYEKMAEVKGRKNKDAVKSEG